MALSIALLSFLGGVLLLAGILSFVWMASNYSRTSSYEFGVGTLIIGVMGLIGGLILDPGRNATISWALGISGTLLTLLVYYFEKKYLEKQKVLKADQERILLIYNELKAKLGETFQESTRPFSRAEYKKTVRHKIESIIATIIFSGGIFYGAYYFYDPSKFNWDPLVIFLCGIAVLIVGSWYAIIYKRQAEESTMFMLRGIITDKEIWESEDSVQNKITISEKFLIMANESDYKKLSFGDVVEVESPESSYIFPSSINTLGSIVGSRNAIHLLKKKAIPKLS